jgi:hypothetical protein
MTEMPGIPFVPISARAAEHPIAVRGRNAGGGSENLGADIGDGLGLDTHRAVRSPLLDGRQEMLREAGSHGSHGLRIGRMALDAA